MSITNWTETITCCVLILTFICTIYYYIRTSRPYGVINAWKKGETLQIKLINYGLDPLFVSKYKCVHYDDKEKIEYTDLLNFILRHSNIKIDSIINARAGDLKIILRPGEETNLINIKLSNCNLEYIKEIFKNLKIKIKYQGVYGIKTYKLDYDGALLGFYAETFPASTKKTTKTH